MEYEYNEKIKKKACSELEDYAGRNKLTVQEWQLIHMLTDIVKNVGKIEILAKEREDGYSEARDGRGGSSYGGMSYDDDMMYSERRGRGRNARRDSMGRYSSDGSSYEGGSSYDDYSEERMNRRYSRDDAKDHLMRGLGSMMESADPNEREILKDAMRKIERA